MSIKKTHEPLKILSLFLKILLVLTFCSVLLPSIVNCIVEKTIIREPYQKPKGNSIFVISESLKESENFNNNFYNILKCFMK